MDTYENNPMGQGSEHPENNSCQQKKESPFADSPYEINQGSAEQSQQQSGSFHAQQNTYGAAPQQPETPAPKKHRSGKVWKRVLSGALVVALVAAGCGITAVSVNSHWNKKSQETNDLLAQMSQKIDQLEEDVKDNSYTGQGNSISGTVPTGDGLTPGQVYAQNKKAVVAISNQSTTANIFGQVTERASSGSGFILSSDGYILTNHHVVEGATTLTVITYDGTKYPARLIGSEESNDVALIKVEGKDLPTVKIGSSDDLIVGDQVVAIGNPMGELTNTLTAGYVSAKERDVSTGSSVINMLQTDAAINPGNSGGPLFNMKGEVVGITTAKYSGSTSSGATIEGIGFAIPIDDVKDMITQIQQNGFVSKPYMGVIVRDYGNGIGVTVESLEPDGSAAKAGIQAGDIIVGIGKYEIKSMADLQRALRDFNVGDSTTIYVYRSRKVLEMPITFGEKPRNTAPETVPTGSDMPIDGSAEQWHDYWNSRQGNEN